VDLVDIVRRLARRAPDLLTGTVLDPAAAYSVCATRHVEAGNMARDSTMGKPLRRARGGETGGRLTRAVRLASMAS
jgi:hypothetical protein